MAEENSDTRRLEEQQVGQESSDSNSAHAKGKISKLRLLTTPRMLEALDELVPGHSYQDCFPASLLWDPKLQLKDLDELLRGTRPYFSPKPPKPVNPEFEARMQRLREQLEEASYQSMVVDTANSSLADTRSELRELKNQLSTIINVLISIFTAAMASWYWTPYWSTGSRVLASLGSAIGLGAIEAFLYFRYITKISQSQEYEANLTGPSRTKKTPRTGALEIKKDQ